MSSIEKNEASHIFVYLSFIVYLCKATTKTLRSGKLVCFCFALNLEIFKYGVSKSVHSFKKNLWSEHPLCSCYPRDTELNQTDKLPAFVAPILVGETNSKYIKKKLKGIIIDHDKGIMIFRGRGLVK